MNRGFYLLFYSIIIISFLYAVNFIESSLIFILIYLLYAFLAVRFALDNNIFCVNRHPYLIETSILIILFSYVLHISTGNLAETRNIFSSIMRISIFLFNIYIIAIIIPKNHFYILCSRISILLVSIPVIFLPFTFLFPDIFYKLFWNTSTQSRWLILDNTYRMTSITNSPRMLATILLIGAISTLYIYQQNNSKLEMIAMIFITIGLILTGSRGQMIGFTIGVLTYWLYYKYGSDIVSIFVYILSFVIVLIILIVPYLANQGYEIFVFDNRVIFWGGTIEAIIKNPYGYGFGYWGSEFIDPFLQDSQVSGSSTHNVYLSMILHLGVVGGVAYFVLIFGSVLQNIIDENHDIVLVAIGISLSVHQMFTATYPFGYSLETLMSIWVIGYLLNDVCEVKSDISET